MRRAAEVCPKNASKCPPDEQVVQKESRWLKKDRRQPTSKPNPISAPGFRWKISLDTRKQPSYTPTHQKQYLINPSEAIPYQSIRSNTLSIQFNNNQSIQSINSIGGLKGSRPRRMVCHAGRKAHLLSAIFRAGGGIEASRTQ